MRMQLSLAILLILEPLTNWHILLTENEIKTNSHHIMNHICSDFDVKLCIHVGRNREPRHTQESRRENGKRTSGLTHWMLFKSCLVFKAYQLVK